MTPEGAIKTAVKDALRDAGYYEFTVNQFNKRGYKVHKGISDLIAIGYGRTLFIEIKTEDGKQSIEQLEFEYQVKEHGGEYHVVRSVDELTAILEKEG